MIEEFTEIFNLYVPSFLDGTKITLQVTGMGIAIGIIFGIPAAVIRVYGGRWARLFVRGYLELFRGTPLLVQLFVVYYGLPEFGITFSRLTAAYIALGLNSGAYQAEYFRGAIQAIGRGQFMAGRSVGMSRLQTIRHIILPQALRLVIPAWSNEAITVLRASAIVFIIAVPDLMAKAKLIASYTYNPIQAYTAVGIAYIILVSILSVILNFIDKRFRIPGMDIEGARE